MTSAALDRALTEPGQSALRRLPDQADGLLRESGAPPRLPAHLRAVHDVAHRLLDQLEQEHPELLIDRIVVLFGAATYDSDKIIHTRELSGPGSADEEAGYQLLLDHRIDPALARFARTHADWTAPDIVEDLVVSLADKVWKAKRVPKLEPIVIDHLAKDAGNRLAFETHHPIIP